MAYRKSTVRRMPPATRKLARLINDLDSVQRRLKNYMADVSEMELWATSARNRARADEEKA